VEYGLINKGDKQAEESEKRGEKGWVVGVTRVSVVGAGEGTASRVRPKACRSRLPSGTTFLLLQLVEVVPKVVVQHVFVHVDTGLDRVVDSHGDRHFDAGRGGV
jgi:hypothetical protein